ncbi:MAG: cation:proton antiporter, partial [Sediminibacterium sp.]
GASITNIFHHKKKSAEEIAESEPIPWKNILIIAWTGTRGVLSLAAALALPLVLHTGRVFPQRHLILFLAFVVIFVTLVVQGLSLPLLIRVLNIKPDTNESKEQKELQLHILQNTLHFIDKELPVELSPDTKNELKNKYNARADKLVKEIRIHKRNENKDTPTPVTIVTPLLNAQIEIAKFQRELLIKIHKEGAHSDAAIKEVQRDMDIDDLKLNQQLPKDEDTPPAM